MGKSERLRDFHNILYQSIYTSQRRGPWRKTFYSEMKFVFSPDKRKKWVKLSSNEGKPSYEKTEELQNKELLTRIILLCELFSMKVYLAYLD